METAQLAPWDPERIKAIYQEIRSAYTGKPYTPSPKWDGEATAFSAGSGRSTWVRMAERLRSAGVDPYPYILYSFAMAAPGKWPMPNYLASEKCLAKFLRYKPELDRRTRADLQMQVQRFVAEATPLFEAGLDPATVLEYVFSLSDLKISPLVRYCIATQYGVESLQHKYFSSAAAQARLQRPHLDVLGPLLPPELQ